MPCAEARRTITGLCRHGRVYADGYKCSLCPPQRQYTVQILVVFLSDFILLLEGDRAMMGHPGDQDIPPMAQNDAIHPATSVDPEKPTVTRLEGSPSVLGSVIDPAVEKRLVRKLDLRLPVLLGALCTAGFTPNDATGNDLY